MERQEVMIEEDKSILIDNLLELMQKVKLNNNYKEKIRKIIDNEKTVTKIEKERFFNVLYGRLHPIYESAMTQGYDIWKN